ncbi:MAG: LysM peptidoglycan-binding protein [Rhodoglobus sp.]|nr:LysM peptidoglycan-binding protein [Rhodoglobus sp.]
MTDDADDVARAVFAGLVPRAPAVPELQHPLPGDKERSRFAKSMFTTVPILLVGSMAAMTLNLTGAVEAANAKPAKPKGAAFDAAKLVRDAVQAKAAAAASTTSAGAPAMYRVTAGDTVSDIAGRFGLSTASVLALNGLSWSSLIFPGQELKLAGGTVPLVELPPAAPSASGNYTIVTGDTISAIADRFGVSTLSVLTANGLGWSSIIYPGQTLVIPGLIGPGTPPPSDAPVDTTVAAPDPATEPDPVVAAPVTTPPVVAPVVETPAAPAAPAPVATGTGYTIVAGDTLSGIAARFGISTQSLLDANGLDLSSVIYAGHTLVIPGPTTASSGDSVTLLDDQMRANASVIVQVGRSLGVPDYGIVIALATAMQESSMRNIDWGDLDSVGLFQQRPSAGWGSVDKLTTPSYAAQLFYGGPSNPNAGYTRGLLDISGWESMSVTQAAQRVQISAYPDAYAKWEASARSWLAELG